VGGRNLIDSPQHAHSFFHLSGGIIGVAIMDKMTDNEIAFCANKSGYVKCHPARENALQAILV
jgi:hypothetical protein